MLNRVADRTRHPFRMRVMSAVAVVATGPGIWSGQATGSAKARVTAAVRLETFSRR
jgi:hypothetical protein